VNMSQELNNNSWQPTCNVKALEERALLYKRARQFFDSRGVIEVETPLMCTRTITDPYIQAFMVDNKYYLQTSPEYAMKRLLANGCKSIYQICKAFRHDEAGNMHNPEFTMIEWYRLGFDHIQLMDEMDLLLQVLLDTTQPARKISYYTLFMENFEINPHATDIDSLQACAKKAGIDLSAAALVGLTVTDWLQILMSYVIEPRLTGPVPWIVYDFPAAQAALAKVIDTVIDTKKCPVAARFEVYMQGMELANGYYELQNPAEQTKRFTQDNAKRLEQGTKQIQADERLLAALEVGLPDCAGVALGLDRVLMLKMQAKSIADVLSFTIRNA